jgi:hypothetical protein
MSEQHTERTPAPLRGYRVLSDEEKALVDEIKLAEEAAAQLWAKARSGGWTDPRMAAHAKTVLQDGFMWLVRSVTKPRDAFAEAMLDEAAEGKMG